MGAGAGDIAKVTFQDGVTIDVDDWEFVYEYGIPLSKESYRAEAKRTKDMIANLGQTRKHGVTTANLRTIGRADLVSIRFAWPVTAYYITTNTTVYLANGETLCPVKLEPPVECLSTNRLAFVQGVLLQGTVTRDNIKWPFSVELRRRGNEPSETVVQIDFPRPDTLVEDERKPSPADSPDAATPAP
jgi:hypothetical protein